MRTNQNVEYNDVNKTNHHVQKKTIPTLKLITYREKSLISGSENCQQILTLHRISNVTHVMIVENATFQVHASSLSFLLREYHSVGFLAHFKRQSVQGAPT